MQYERGCLPCTNCIIAVPQDRYFAAERFGSFYNLYGPGLSCVGLDLCGLCISLRSRTSRVEQLSVQVPTKTQDSVFVEIGVAVQFSVKPDGAQDAFYKLSDVGAQIDSYVSDVVRSQIPKLTLDQAFEAKDSLSTAIMEDLSSHMDGFGFLILKALVTDVAVGQEVMRSMNEVNKQKRLRDASVMAAEAEKIRTVTAAEAEADAAHLAGEGIARQRAAIVQGLRDSIAITGREPEQGDIVELLLATQYFETLKEIGSHNNCKAYFLPDTKKDPDAQVRSGFLQGQTALEFFSGMPGRSPARTAAQQQQASRVIPLQEASERLGRREAITALCVWAFEAPGAEYFSLQENKWFRLSAVSKLDMVQVATFAEPTRKGWSPLSHFVLHLVEKDFVVDPSEANSESFLPLQKNDWVILEAAHDQNGAWKGWGYGRKYTSSAGGDARKGHFRLDYAPKKYVTISNHS